MTGLDIGVYVPQMGFSYHDVLHRALRCEELGIGSLWLYDHMYGPGFPDMASLEAWTLATALLSRTERLRVGHMVFVQSVSSPRGAGQDGDHPRPGVGRPAGFGYRQRLHRGRAPPVGSALGNVRRAFRALGRDAGYPDPGLRQRGDRLRGLAIHGARYADRARARPAAAAAHHRRRGRAKSTRCPWLRDMPTSGMCPPTRSASSSTRCRCCGPSARTSAAIPPPSCCRSKPS